MNPYQLVLDSICQSLSGFDDDHQIPCCGIFIIVLMLLVINLLLMEGFGDVLTRSDKVFSFLENDIACDGLESIHETYKSVCLNANLSG